MGRRAGDTSTRAVEDRRIRAPKNAEGGVPVATWDNQIQWVVALHAHHRVDIFPQTVDAVRSIHLMEEDQPPWDHPLPSFVCSLDLVRPT